MRPRIQQIVDESIDRVINQGRMDLIADFAFRLPVIVICDMLGIPEEDREIFFARERTGGRLLDPVPLSREEIDAANTSHKNSEAYFQKLFDLRRRAAGRRSHHAAGAGRGGRQQADERGVDRQHHPAVRRRPRDHGQPDRQRVARAASQSRAARQAEGQSAADAERDRGIPALRFVGAAHRPRRDGRHRGRRYDDPDKAKT